MTKIVPSDLINPTLKTIKNWNCSFIATEGPNILDKLSLEDLAIPYESQYRSRVILEAGVTDKPLIYGFIGASATFLMIKVTYDSENDPYYQYEEENYNITYYFENDPIEKPLGRILVMTGSVEERIPQIYLNNNLGYDVTLDVLHATIDPEYSGVTSNGFGMENLIDVMFSGLTSGDTLQWNGYYWTNVTGVTSGGGGGTDGTSGSSGTSGVDGQTYGTSGTDGTSGSSGVDGQTYGTSGTDGTSGVDGSVTGVTYHSEFYYSDTEQILYVPEITASFLNLTGLTSSGTTNYIVVDDVGKLYKTSVIAVTENVTVAKVGGGTRTLHYVAGLYVGYTDS